MTDQENRLAILEQADKLLANIKTTDDARHIAATADAARAYAKELNLGLDVENRAMEIKIWAQYSAGSILIELEKRGELKTIGGSPVRLENVPTVYDLGFTRSNADYVRLLCRQGREPIAEAIRNIWDAEIPLSDWGVLRYIQNKHKEKQPHQPVKTKEDLFTEVKEHIQGIKDAIVAYEADNSEGNASRFYLRYIYRALTEIAAYLHKKGYSHEYEPEG